VSLSDIVAGRERASGAAERHHSPAKQAAGEHSRRTAPPRAAAFWLIAGVLCLLFYGACQVVMTPRLPVGGNWAVDWVT
jgi:hypothetical protein